MPLGGAGGYGLLEKVSICLPGPLEVMTTILFPVLYDHEEGIERLVSQTSLRFNAHRVLASAAKSDLLKWSLELALLCCNKRTLTRSLVFQVYRITNALEAEAKGELARLSIPFLCR